LRLASLSVLLLAGMIFLGHLVRQTFVAHRPPAVAPVPDWGCARPLLLVGPVPQEGLICRAPGESVPAALAARGLPVAAIATASAPVGPPAAAEERGDGEPPLLVRPATGGPGTAWAVEPMPGAALLALGLPLDLNRARTVDLEALPGVGPVLARRITEDRERRGPFGRVDDLVRVRGVGAATLKRLRPSLEVNP